mmetsp:Transcript_33690/g.44444  ORF Transcript_33690/g.44444 Transcript_33690/m.44444 type:complete len:150 (-) Transcript_33690:220-669(-)
MSGKKGGSSDGAPAVAGKKQERTKEQKQASFKFMLGYAKRECCSVILGVIFMLGASSVEVLMPIFLGEVVDSMASGEFDKVGTLCAYFLILVVVAGISVFMRAAIFNILSERVARNLRKDYYSSLVSKDLEFFDDRRTGELISRLNSDI